MNEDIKERQQRLINNGYVIIEIKSFLIIGMYSKNANNPIKRFFHYLPVRIEKKIESEKETKEI